MPPFASLSSVTPGCAYDHLRPGISQSTLRAQSTTGHGAPIANESVQRGRPITRHWIHRSSTNAVSRHGLLLLDDYNRAVAGDPPSVHPLECSDSARGAATGTGPRLQTGEETADLPPGRMVVLQPKVLHSVEALEEGAFLLSIAYVGRPGKSD
jgi:hypothetical protein